jgi:hypothetical protein
MHNYQESPHSENTACPRSKKEERERERVFIRLLISNKTPQTINEKENSWRYRLGTVSGKTICHRGLNQVLGCTNLILASTGSHQQTSTSCFGEITPTAHQLNNVACKSTQTYKT